MNTDQNTKARPGLDMFHDCSYGKLALSKFGEVPPGFFIYCCGWKGDITTPHCIMEVTGGEFRIAKSGKYKGMYSILVRGTDRTVYLTSAEVDAAKE